ERAGHRYPPRLEYAQKSQLRSWNGCTVHIDRCRSGFCIYDLLRRDFAVRKALNGNQAIMNPPDSQPSAFRFDDPRQARIYERLARLVGSGPAAFFRDGCRIMQNPSAFESTTHVVSHLLREIESALRDVVEPISKK